MTSPGSAPSAQRSLLGHATFYVTSFATLGIYMQFFPGWLRAAGAFTEGQVSLVLSAQTIARTAMGPFWSHLVDRLGGARTIVIGLSCASIGAVLLFGLGGPWQLAWLAALLFGAVYSPMFPIVDGAAMHGANVHGYAFGRVRMAGSISYLVVILLMGGCLDLFGGGIVFPVLVAAMVAMAASSFALARDVQPAPAEAAAPAAPPTPWWHLLRSRPFVLLLVATAAIQGSHATFYNLSTMHWRDHGIDNTMAGVLWAEGVLAEIVLFLVARETVERLRPTTLILLGGGAAVLRWCVVGATTSVPWLLATGWLHALSFGCTYLGSLRALERRVPAAQRATAQGLLGAANSGLGMVVCGVSGGLVYERWEGFAFFLMAAFAGVGVGLSLCLRRMADSKSIAPIKAATENPE